MRPLVALLLVVPSLSFAAGQFVRPTAKDHEHEPGLYTEDPFITEYRHRFFAVFNGDVKTFRKAYGEIANMVVEKPNDARARVWLGNGQTVEAAIELLHGQKVQSLELLKVSRRNLDQAVSTKPKDPNIYMMRAATLYIQGQYWPAKDVAPVVWETLKADCERFVAFLGPDRIGRVSVHVRGETYGELGIACKNLGDKQGARIAFTKVVSLCPGTEYAVRATKELNELPKM
jgi:hypothetical protein